MKEQPAILGGPTTVTMRDELAAAAKSPIIGDEERAAVLEAMSRESIYSPTAEFEEDFARYHGVQFALGHNNGTSTLHAAFFAAGVQPGDEVICPAYTWHLAVSPVLALHAVPVFCDVDPATGCISPEDIERKVSPHTRAISILHPFGAVAPMDEIMAVAGKHGLPVIEDASHAHGAEYKGRKVGTIGDIGCFSLQASKIMAAIEGGILITNKEEYYERAILLGHFERIPKLKSERYRKYNNGKGVPFCFGHKHRMHPWAAAMARAQLRSLDERNAVRCRNADYLSDGIRKLGDFLTPPVEASGTKRTYLNYICQYRPEAIDGVSRDRFVEALNAEGLGASAGRAGYMPVYWNPVYEERSVWAEGCPFDCVHSHRGVEYGRGICPEAEALPQRTVGLPVFCNPCDDALLDQCIEAIAKVYRNREQLRSR